MKGMFLLSAFPSSVFVAVLEKLRWVLIQSIFRIPFDGKASTPLSIRDTSSGPNAPDIEVLWFPVVVLGFGVPPPKGVHGVSIVRRFYPSSKIQADQWACVCYLAWYGRIQGAMALKPESSGSVRLKTSSVYDKPLIDPKFVLLISLGIPVFDLNQLRSLSLLTPFMVFLLLHNQLPLLRKRSEHCSSWRPICSPARSYRAHEGYLRLETTRRGYDVVFLAGRC